jgi:hypothetical protein
VFAGDELEMSFMNAVAIERVSNGFLVKAFDFQHNEEHPKDTYVFQTLNEALDKTLVIFKEG